MITFLWMMESAILLILCLKAVVKNQGPMRLYIRVCYWVAARMSAYSRGVESGYITYSAELASNTLKEGEWLSRET